MAQDPRITEVQEQEEQALTNLEELYGGILESSDQHFSNQVAAVEQWQQSQTEQQQAQTDFQIEQIQQSQEKAEQDYQKEQSASYVDYQKQSNQYGYNAEQMAAAGLAGSGYSESSRVDMYTAYQNRVAIAKQSIAEAKQEFDNAIRQAQLTNDAVMAEIAQTALQQKLSLQTEAFNYKNNLLLQLESEKQQRKDTYWNRLMNIYDQINAERSLALQAASIAKRNAEDKEEDFTTSSWKDKASNILLDFSNSDQTYGDAIEILRRYGYSGKTLTAVLTKGAYLSKRENPNVSYEQYLANQLLHLVMHYQ